MKRIENRHAERILSLLVILYGLWLVIPNAEILLHFLTRGWYPFVFFFFEFYSQSYTLSYTLSKIAIGCWLILFFPYVVHWVGNFSSHEKVRSKRHWSPFEFFAASLILFIFSECLIVFFFVVDTLVMITAPDIEIVYSEEFFFNWGVIFFPLLYLGIAVLCLLCVRPITAWLLCKAD